MIILIPKTQNTQNVALDVVAPSPSIMVRLVPLVDCYRLVLPSHAVKHATDGTDPCDSPWMGAKSTIIPWCRLESAGPLNDNINNNTSSPQWVTENTLV